MWYIAISAWFVIPLYLQTDKESHGRLALYRFLHSRVCMTCLSQLTFCAKVAKVRLKLHGRKPRVSAREYIHEGCASFPGRKAKKLFTHSLSLYSKLSWTLFEIRLNETRWFSCCSWTWWVQLSSLRGTFLTKFHSRKHDTQDAFTYSNITKSYTRTFSSHTFKAFIHKIHKKNPLKKLYQNRRVI